MAFSDNIDNPALWLSELSPVVNWGGVGKSVIGSLKGGNQQANSQMTNRVAKEVVATEKLKRKVLVSSKTKLDSSKRQYIKRSDSYWGQPNNNAVIRAKSIYIGNNNGLQQHDVLSGIGGDAKSTNQKQNRSIFRVEVVNATNDIVQPLSDFMRINSLDLFALMNKHHLESIKHQEAISSNINLMGRDSDVVNRGLIRWMRQFWKHPVWASLSLIGNVLSGTASLFGSILFGSKKELTISEKILKATKEQTEFLMKGSIDRTESFMDKLIRRGLVGSIAAGVAKVGLGAFGISRSKAQQREEDKSKGTLKSSITGWFSDMFYGDNIKKFGRQGGIFGSSKIAPEGVAEPIKRGEAVSHPLYVSDNGFVALISTYKDEMGEGRIIEHESLDEQKHYRHDFAKFSHDEKERHKIDKDIKDELKSLNKKTFWQLLGSGIGFVVGGIASLGSKLAGMLTPLLIAVAGGFAGLMKLMKRTNFLLNLQTAKLLKDVAKDTKEIITGTWEKIFGKKKPGDNGIFPDCIRICNDSLPTGGKGDQKPKAPNPRPNAPKPRTPPKPPINGSTGGLPNTSIGGKPLAIAGAAGVVATGVGAYYTSEGEIDTLKEAEYKKFKELQSYKETAPTKEQEKLDKFLKFNKGKWGLSQEDYAKKFPKEYAQRMENENKLRSDAYLANIRQQDENEFGISAEKKIASEFSMFSSERMEAMQHRLRLESEAKAEQLNEKIVSPMTDIKDTALKQLEEDKSTANALDEYLTIVKATLTPEQRAMLDAYNAQFEPPEETWAEKAYGKVTNFFSPKPQAVPNANGIPADNVPVDPNFRNRLFNVNPSTFGQEQDLSELEAMQIPQVAPIQTPSIPPQSMNQQQGDSQVVAMLSSIDSKLSNVNSSPNTNKNDMGNNMHMAGGHDKRTVFSIFGEGAVV